MPSNKKKLIRVSTVAMSLNILLKGQLKFLNQYYHVIAVSGEDEHLKNVQKREEVRTVPISIKRTISPINDLKSLWKLFWLFKQENPAIVHSMTPKAGLLTMLASFFARVPIRIHTYTGLVFPSKEGLFQKLLICLDKLLCKCATHIYPEGLGVKNELQKFNITSKPLKVLANGNINGINTEYFNPDLYSTAENEKLKKSLEMTDNDFIFIFVGRLVGDKGINELISAFKILSSKSHQGHTEPVEVLGGRKLPTIKLLLVGPYEKELDPLLPETLFQINNNSNIVTTGYQDDVRPYLAIADVFVFPSYREGFPNVVMQAGAMGLPSIVTDINGCNEIIRDGENGLIIPSKDNDALLNAMLTLMNDDDLRKGLSDNSRYMITSRFQQQLVWEAQLEEYKKLENCTQGSSQ